MWLAVAGFCASLLVHVLSLLGLRSPLGSITWLLHIGVLAVWIPTVLVAQRLSKNAKRADLWRAVLRGCPAWMRTGVYVVAGYAMVNFGLFIVDTMSYSKNRVPEVLQYRGFSGHWMAFYYVAAATLYSAHTLGSSSQRRCGRGHEVSPFASYCDLCGAPVPPPNLT